MIYQDSLDWRALERYAADLNARARRCLAPGQLAAADIRDRILASGGRCEWCGQNLVRGPFELDHVVSLREGGLNAAGNLAVACPECNRRKGRKHPARFAAEIYQSSGRRTALLDKIFAHFACEPREQLSLFTVKPGAGDQAEPEPEGPAPYRW